MREYAFARLLVRAVCSVVLLGATHAAYAQRARTARTTTTRTAARTATAAGDYNRNTVLGSARIEVDPETRSLIVVSDDETSEEIARIIQSLDRPKPQVLIKVLFLEATYSDGFDIGMEGLLGYTHDGVNQGVVETAWGLANQTDGAIWSLLGDYWQTTLRAIAESGQLEILSRPSILARNNQEAVIIVGEEVPFVSDSLITDTGQTRTTIQYADVGIILRVTPFITRGGEVEMIVAPEISTLTDESVRISETLSSPIISKRSAETVVVTPHGKTVVIGGLMAKSSSEATVKIPLLGDIPLLGMAFRRKAREDVKKELLIFLTPYIIDAPDQVSAMHERETRGMELVPRAFSSEELNAYLDNPLGIEDDPEEEPQEDEVIRDP